jgi:hypothetical protein
MRFAEKPIKTTATLADLNLYNRRAIYLTSNAQEKPGYYPRFDVNTGLEISVSGLNHLGLVD